VQAWVTWTNNLNWTKAVSRAYHAAARTLHSTHARTARRTLLQACWGQWTRVRLGSAMARTERMRLSIQVSRFFCLFGFFCFFVSFVSFDLFIDLLTDQVQPLS